MHKSNSYKKDCMRVCVIKAKLQLRYKENGKRHSIHIV